MPLPLSLRLMIQELAHGLLKSLEELGVAVESGRGILAGAGFVVCYG